MEQKNAASLLLFRGPVMLSVSFVFNFFIQFRSWWGLKSAQTLKASHFLISPNKSRGGPCFVYRIRMLCSRGFNLFVSDAFGGEGSNFKTSRIVDSNRHSSIYK
jgi:hypothetical protein